jgi:predicted DNA-binding transcriptional regulator AlpA
MEMNMHSPTPLIKDTEAAKRLGLEVATLRRWRWSGKGPAFVKVGSAVRYDPAIIDQFIDGNRRSSTSA